MTNYSDLFRACACALPLFAMSGCGESSSPASNVAVTNPDAPFVPTKFLTEHPTPINSGEGGAAPLDEKRVPSMPVDQAALAADHTTPQGAVLVFETAIAKQDHEAVASTMDFEMAANHLLTDKLKIPAAQVTPEQLEVAAKNLRTDRVRQVLELAGEHPSNASRRFTAIEPRHPEMAVVTREIVSASGTKSELRILVGKSTAGWRVLELLD